MWWLWLLIGIIVGACLSSVVFFITHPKIGTFKIDKSNPDKDVYRLDVGDLEKISKKKHVRLKIDSSADLSQE